MNAFQKVATVGLLLGTAACTTTDGFQDNAPVNTGTPTAAAPEARGGFNPVADVPSRRGTNIAIIFQSAGIAAEFARNYPTLAQTSIRESEAIRNVSRPQNPGPNDGGYERFTRDELAEDVVTLGGVTAPLGQLARIEVTEDIARPSVCPSENTILVRAFSPRRTSSKADYAANIQAPILCGPQF